MDSHRYNAFGRHLDAKTVNSFIISPLIIFSTIKFEDFYEICFYFHAIAPEVVQVKDYTSKLEFIQFRLSDSRENIIKSGMYVLNSVAFVLPF